MYPTTSVGAPVRRDYVHESDTSRSAGERTNIGEERSRSLLDAPLEGSLPILGRLHLLMIKASQTSREADRKAEEQFAAEEAAADAARIREMRNKADKAFALGMVSAGLQVATAVASSVATGRELKALAVRDSAVGEKVEASARALERVRAQKELVDANCKAVDGARAGIDAYARAASAHSDTEIAKLENQSKAARRSADRVRAEEEATQQAEAKLLQLAKEITDAQAACERAALLRM